MSEARIYQTLRKAGLTRAGALGVMGNIGAESGCISCRVQGDFGSGFEYSRQYTAQVDAGNISRHDFIHAGPNGGGYGLCQWTWYSRKEGLYDYAKSKGVSISDETMQVEYLIKELKSDYAGLYQFLCSCESMYDATEKFCKEFERPEVNNINDRFQLACQYANKPYDSEIISDDPDPAPAAPVQGSTDSCEITVRVLRRGDKGRDVYLLQCGLHDMGLYCTKEDSYARLDGDFGSKTERAVTKFRTRHNLPGGGTADQDVWQILFQ